MTIYALMGLASWMVWTHGGFEQQKVPLPPHGATFPCTTPCKHCRSSQAYRGAWQCLGQQAHDVTLLHA